MGPCRRGRRRRGIIWRTTPPLKDTAAGGFRFSIRICPGSLNLLSAAQTYSCLGHCITRGISLRRQATIFRLRGAARSGRDAARHQGMPSHLFRISRHLCDNAATATPRLAVQVHSFFQISERSSLVNELPASYIPGFQASIQVSRPSRPSSSNSSSLPPIIRNSGRCAGCCMASSAIMSRNSTRRRCHRTIADRAYQRLLRSLAELDRTARAGNGSLVTSTAWRR